MSEPELLERKSAEFTSGSKWIAGISCGQTVCEVASRVLDARLKAVCHALPLAAQNSDDDVEHVHRLRISVRRAVEAVRVFSALVPEVEVGPLRDHLRRIRRAADEARNWDVMTGRFSHGAGIRLVILEQIKARRRESQGPIVAVHQQLETDACRAKIEQWVREVESHRHGRGKRRFGRQAPCYLAPVVAKFFQTAESELTTDESLHTLRIRAKRVRYTMEIVAVAFNAAFRERLYPQMTVLQDVLGTVNDHATALTLFGEWLSKSEVPAERAFLEGLVLAEQQATADLRAAFLATWTPNAVSRLKQQFADYC